VRGMKLLIVGGGSPLSSRGVVSVALGGLLETTKGLSFVDPLERRHCAEGVGTARAEGVGAARAEGVGAVGAEGVGAVGADTGSRVPACGANSSSSGANSSSSTHAYSMAALAALVCSADLVVSPYLWMATVPNSPALQAAACGVGSVMSAGPTEELLPPTIRIPLDTTMKYAEKGRYNDEVCRER
jgi:hypothetical protein